MTTALVTGAAGFIGSNLVRDLLERGYRVRGLDDLSTGRRENLAGLPSEDPFDLLEADLREGDELATAVEDVDVVFHQAAIPSVPRSVEDPQLTTEANCLGTANLLVAARDGGVETVVVASSSSVYGSSGDLPKRESMPVDPESPYALSKYFTEELAVQFAELYGIDTVALRYFNVFGPRQDPASEYAAVIPTFIARMLDGDRPVIYGDGEQSRDFTYVENVLAANVLAAEGTASGEVFNVGCGERFTVNELVERLNDLLGTDLEPVYEAPRPGDVRHSRAAIERIRTALGYEPVVDFDTGLERTVAFMRE